MRIWAAGNIGQQAFLSAVFAQFGFRQNSRFQDDGKFVFASPLRRILSVARYRATFRSRLVPPEVQGPFWYSCPLRCLAHRAILRRAHQRQRVFFLLLRMLRHFSPLLSPLCFSKLLLEGATTILTEGVSNSSCTSPLEFAREAERLTNVLACCSANTRFVYFGTCSVADPDARHTPYVEHKLAMEALVSSHRNSTIFRLPQVVGRTPNPHTLFNYLYARIARSERITVWQNAKRYLIHENDMARIAQDFLVNQDTFDAIIDIASAEPYSIFEIISGLERLVGKPAVFERVGRGSHYIIDSSRCAEVAERLAIDFGPGYLEHALARTYLPPEQGAA